MPIIKDKGVSVIPEHLPSKERKPSAELRELVAKLPPEAKEKSAHFIAAIEKVEHTEKYAEGNTATIERLKQRLEEIESGDHNMITAMQAKLDQQDANRRLVIRTALFMFAGQYGVDIEPEDVDNLVRFL